VNAPQSLTQVAAAVAGAGVESDLERLLRSDYIPKARELMLSPTLMDRMWRFAEMMAKGTLTTPDHLRGKPHDCFAIVMQATLWNMDPFAVAQKTHVINGKLGYEAQLVNAVLQKSGAIVGSPKYGFNKEGSNTLCRVGCVIAGETEITWGEWHSSGAVQVKNSPLWKTNVPQQMGYLQLKNWARLYTPGAILGVQTVDELMDVPDALLDMPPAPPPAGPRRKSENAAGADVAAAPVGTNMETGEIPPPAVDVAATPASTTAHSPAAAATPPAGDARGAISTGQVAYLRNKLKAAGMSEAEAAKRYNAEALEQINVDAFDELKSELLAMN